ncbi:MAG: FtsQ-type POTRA domain-containing protein [Nannocystis sp.]|nr:FtsQ-type POTRA domain-containing protein [Nannocystis sp.]
MPTTTAQRNARRANPRRAPVIAAQRAPQPALRLSALFRPRASARPRPNARARGANRRRRDADTSAAPTQRLTPAVAPRLARRARDLSSLLGRFGVALCLAYGLLVGAQAFAAYVTTAPRFEAAQLLVKPTPHLSAERIAALMAIEPGTNILALDLRELERRIAADGWVSAVELRRELPDTLRIAVTEHQPAAVLLLAGRFFLVDRAGHPFKILGPGERGDLPVITGASAAALTSGDSGPIQRALAASDAWSAAARPPLGEIHLGEAGELTLYPATGQSELRLGRGPIEGKLARYDALRAALGDRADRLAVVHLDATSAPGAAERIVASFLTPEDEAAVLGRGEAAVAAREAPTTKPGKRPKKKARIPRYE